MMQMMQYNYLFKYIYIYITATLAKQTYLHCLSWPSIVRPRYSTTFSHANYSNCVYVQHHNACSGSTAL